ncbi:formylglycine-generating enzyme family protein [Desulfobacterales bacterium HSG2]|nr:formylglycine-generating enzyme family protein [Desulfobacterales bacterium HSG2]
MKQKAYVLIAAVAWLALAAIINCGEKSEERDAKSVPVRNSQSGKHGLKPAPDSQPKIPKFLTNTVGMKFVYIPPGSFMMGSPRDEAGRYVDREKQHQVKLTRGFYMQVTEVTQGQWEAVMKKNPSYFKNCGKDCPVEQVSWNDVQRFVWRLNHRERLHTYSIPTEAEWEYACRAGTVTRFNWGDEADCSKANYGVAFIRNECKEINPGRTVKVGSFPPNAWGLYDMHGNVGEWCLDRFDNYPSKEVTDPAGGYATVDRVYRGGSWSVISRYCRSANRDADSPNAKLGDVGFRLVRSVSGYRTRGLIVDPYPVIQQNENGYGVAQ